MEYIKWEYNHDKSRVEISRKCSRDLRLYLISFQNKSNYSKEYSVINCANVLDPAPKDVTRVENQQVS